MKAREWWLMFKSLLHYNLQATPWFKDTPISDY